jgi:hypothetical protein
MRPPPQGIVGVHSPTGAEEDAPLRRLGRCRGVPLHASASSDGGASVASEVASLATSSFVASSAASVVASLAASSVVSSAASLVAESVASFEASPVSKLASIETSIEDSLVASIETSFVWSADASATSEPPSVTPESKAPSGAPAPIQARMISICSVVSAVRGGGGMRGQGSQSGPVIIVITRLVSGEPGTTRVRPMLRQ